MCHSGIASIGRVHWRNGFFDTAAGFDLPLLIGLGAVAVAIAGPGLVDIDRLLGTIGFGTTLMLLALAVLGGLATVVLPAIATHQRMAHQS